MIFGGSERSTYHTTMVNRVNGHLRRICTSAEKEIGLVDNRITDAWGYDAKTRTYYLCEIKVNYKDLQKAVYQIHDTAFRYKPKYDREATIIPVIAFPRRLYEELVDNDNWKSFRDICNKSGVAIWSIEQSTVRQIHGPKPKLPKTKPTNKAKATAKPKPASKAKAATKFKPAPKAKTVTKVKSATKAKTATKAKAVRTRRKTI